MTNGKTNDFCKKISNDEFELQRDALSDQALNELLQSIMQDDTISERDKLKWIKQVNFLNESFINPKLIFYNYCFFSLKCIIPMFMMFILPTIVM